MLASLSPEMLQVLLALIVGGACIEVLASGVLLRRKRPGRALLLAASTWLMLVPYFAVLQAAFVANRRLYPEIVAAKSATTNWFSHALFGLPALAIALVLALLAAWRLMRRRSVRHGERAATQP